MVVQDQQHIPFRKSPKEEWNAAPKQQLALSAEHDYLLKYRFAGWAAFQPL
jgi:hypothetical protein